MYNAGGMWTSLIMIVLMLAIFVVPAVIIVYLVNKWINTKKQNQETQVKDKDIILSLANHSEIMSSLEAYCKGKDLKAGLISGIGAVNSATLRFFDPQTKKYVDKTFSEQMEIANLTVNISMLDGKVYLHLHVTLGRDDYSTIAGHLLSATVNGACELSIRKINKTLNRKFDPEIGLNVYDF